jgi:hypothetical protein
MTVEELTARGLRVKPLEDVGWTHDARNGWKLGVAYMQGHHILRRDDGWHYSNGAGGIFPTLAAAKAAADADHAARIAAQIEETQ